MIELVFLNFPHAAASKTPTSPKSLLSRTMDSPRSTSMAGSEGISSARLILEVVYNRKHFVTAHFSATATITATAEDAQGHLVSINAGEVTWTVVSSSISAAWWANRSSDAMNGLVWGATPLSLNAAESEQTAVEGTAPTGAKAMLTDIVGSRTVVIQAAMPINGAPHAASITVGFGDGPLSVFAEVPTPANRMNWTASGAKCGTAGDAGMSGYQACTRLPTVTQLQNVAGYGYGGQHGAAHAAGWPDDGDGYGWFRYWTGEAEGAGNYARLVSLDIGNDNWTSITNDNPVAVCMLENCLCSGV